MSTGDSDPRARAVTIFIGVLCFVAWVAYEVFAKATGYVSTISVALYELNQRHVWLPCLTVFWIVFLHFHTLMLRPGRILDQPVIPEPAFYPLFVQVMFFASLGCYAAYRFGLMPR